MGSPLKPESIALLKKALSIKGKACPRDWSFLIKGIGGGLLSDEWEDTITLQELFDILTHELTDEEYQDVLDRDSKYIKYLLWMATF